MKLGLGLSIPGAVAQQRGSAQKAYSRAVFRLDARFNPSTGAPTDLSANALTVQNGSTSGADANDALYLPAPSTYGVTRYVYLPGISGNYLSAPDEAALDITGDIDLRVHCALDDWTPSSGATLLAKYVTTGNQRSYRLEATTAGGLAFYFSPDGTAVTTVLATANHGFTDGAARWARVALDVDNGAGGYTVTFYTSTDGITWSQLGDPVVGGATTSIFAGTAPLEIGTINTGTSLTSRGRFFRSQVRNGIDGPVVFDWSASDTVNSTHTSFTASTGQTVTVNRATSGRKTVVVEAAKWLLGTDDYIEVADNALLDIDAATSFTVIGVIRQMGASPVADGPWISKRAAAGTGTGWGVRTNGATLVAHAGVEDTGADEQTRTTTALTAGALSMVGFVVDRTAGTIAAVRNGALTATASLSAVGDCSNALPMRIGRQADGTVYQDFENYAWYIWREALTASELAAIAADWGAV